MKLRLWSTRDFPHLAVQNTLSRTHSSDGTTWSRQRRGEINPDQKRWHSS